MSKRKAVYVFDHISVKTNKLIKAYKNRDKKLYKDFDHKTLVDIVAHLSQIIVSKMQNNKDEYDLNDLKVETNELEYYLKRTEKSCLTRTEFMDCREKYYSDYLLDVTLIKKND